MPTPEQCGLVWPLRRREPPPPPDASYPELQYDVPDAVTKFRMPCELQDRNEFAELKCSGSAQFGSSAWRTIVETIRERSPDAIVDVDLRQESHGFVRPEWLAEDLPIYWRAENDWGSSGAADTDAIEWERARLSVLARSPAVRVARDGVRHDLRIRGASDESGLVSGAASYVRIPVTDHMGPSGAAVDAFVAEVRGRLRERPWYHFHCRAGVGRTTLFMTMFDMLWNAYSTSCCSIIERNCVLSDYDLSRVVPGITAEYMSDRWDFIRTFHAYARERPLDTGLKWSDWSPRKS